MEGRFNSRSARLGRAVANGLLVAGLGASAGACGLSNDLSTAATGPLLALKASDTVVETNLQTAETALQSGAPADQVGTGITTTAGPSTSYNVLSVSSTAGQATVLAGYNQLSRDCLGLVDLTGPGVSVLGQTQVGTYYFWIAQTSSSTCDAAGFAATPAVPKAWPSGDPSSTGWPIP